MKPQHTLWTAALALVLGWNASCATPRAGSPGTSDAARVAPREEPRVAEQAPVWPSWDASRAWPVIAQYESQGHRTAVRQVALRISPEAEAAYRALVKGGQLAAGSVIIQELSATQGAPVEQLLVMQKSERGWQYLSLRPDGRLMDDADSRAGGLCQRCHLEGRSDELFGLP